MKYSRQRELILETVMENPVHPTADTVYAMVREQEPNISLGTVYRNLNLLAEQGILRRIPIRTTICGAVAAATFLICRLPNLQGWKNS